MGEINVSINNRNYGIACDDGQEQRVAELGHYVDSRLREISQAGAAANDPHLLVLTTLVLADEIFNLRDNLADAEGRAAANGSGGSSEDDAAVANAISSLAERIDVIADKLQKA